MQRLQKQRFEYRDFQDFSEKSVKGRDFNIFETGCAGLFTENEQNLTTLIEQAPSWLTWTSSSTHRASIAGMGER
jgi:hypothetical protein